jgi:hypothetical protein
MARMPSAKPTWASCRGGDASPTAHTLGSRGAAQLVDRTWPRSSTSTPVPSPGRRCRGRRPTDTTTRSTSIVSPSPKSTTVVPPVAVGLWPGDRHAGRTSMPFFLNARSTTLVTSSSQPGRILGRASRMVTWRPGRPGSTRTRSRWRRRRSRGPRGQVASWRNSSEVTTAGRRARSRGWSAAPTRGEDDGVAVRVDSPLAAPPHDVVVGVQVPTPCEHGDLALLEQARTAPCAAVDHLLLAAWVVDQSTDRLGGDAEVTACSTWSDDRGRSRAAPWPGCSPGAGRCRRPCPSRPWRSFSPAGAVERRAAYPPGHPDR